MPTIMQLGLIELLSEGVKLGQEGKYLEAIQTLRRATELDRESAEAWFNLGVALRAGGDNGEAIGAFESAVNIRPDWAEAWFNLGNALRDASDSERAVQCFERATRFRPHYAKAWNNLGNAYCEAGKLEKAENAFQESLRQKPQYPEALFNLGRVYKRQRKFQLAVEVVERALAIQPGAERYLLRLADLQQQLGNLDAARATLGQALQTSASHSAALQLAQLHRTRKDDAQAIAVLENAERAGPISAEALCLRAEAKRSLGRPDDAIADLLQAEQLEPDSAQVQNLLGVVYLAKAQPHKALSHHEAAVRLKPASAEIHNNQGAALKVLGRHAESNECFKTALRLKPDFAVAHLNYALACLGEGDFETGWREFEWRFLCRDFKMRSLHLPRWNGEDLRGKTIVLRAEQGLGDTIQFVRYARPLKDRGARVIVECQAAVKQLLASCACVDEVFRRGEGLSKADVQLPMMSLPGVAGTSLASIPSDVPYLSADRARTEHWRQKLEGLGALKVGIAWQGNRKFASDHLRSFHVSHFAHLAALPGVALVSLQKNDGAEQLCEDLGFQVHDFTAEMDQDVPFADTAAMISAVDLVITSDTSIAHLAGALGRPVWAVLGFSADWRWMNSGSTSPWYPTMRLFRQREFNHWPSAFEDVQQELQRLLAGGRTVLSPLVQSQAVRSITVPIPIGELFDRISILEIKRRKIADASKLRYVEHELAEISGLRPRAWESDEAVRVLVAQLDEANQRLWEVEDRLRDCERYSDFGSGFIELARSVYQLNDGRAAAKRALSEYFGSDLQEVKSYKLY